MSKTYKNRPDLIAYSVTQTSEKNYFNRVGVAWQNSKGGYQIKLEAFPVNGELVLLPPREQQD